MRVLHFTHGSPEYIPPPTLSSDQVAAGPNIPDTQVEGQVRGIRTPRGTFDAAAALEKIYREWRPDLVVVRVDATKQCLPRNLAAFACPAVLLVGDTHHSFAGLSDGKPVCRPSGLNLSYARSEPFAATCLDYTRQHAHFFVEAGLPRVHWLPGLNVARMPIVNNGVFAHGISMVGQVGSFHVRRSAVARAMQDAGVPVVITRAPPREARQLHASSQVSVNCSLNGDLNLRVLEVLQTGSALLTDRLSPEAGLDLLLQHGVHMHEFDAPSDAVTAARELLADRVRCIALGTSGRAHYESLLAPEVMARHLLTIVEGGDIPAIFDVHEDGRTRLIDQTCDLESLQRRVEVYEVLQMLHLLSERLSLLATPTVSARMLADLVDLPRLRAHRHGDDQWPLSGTVSTPVDVALKRAGVADRVPVIEPPDARSIDVLLATASDCRTRELDALLERHRSAVLLVEGGVSPADAAAMRIEPVKTFPALWQRLS